MTELLPLRVYMCPNGEYGIIHIHSKGADVLMTEISFDQAKIVINKAMVNYPQGGSADSFTIKENINQIFETLN